MCRDPADGTWTNETVHLHGQELIDMTGDEFETAMLSRAQAVAGSPRATPPGHRPAT
jgi:hypothetical protein